MALMLGQLGLAAVGVTGGTMPAAHYSQSPDIFNHVEMMTLLRKR
jgi:hypothetical protein